MSPPAAAIAGRQPATPAPLKPAADALALGAAAPRLPASVALTRVQRSRDHVELTLTAAAAERGLAGERGGIDRPSVCVAWVPGAAPAGAAQRYLGFQCAEFGLPVRARDGRLNFDFFDRPGYARPRSVLPLLCLGEAGGDGGRAATLVAPLDRFHEQVLAVGVGGEREGPGRASALGELRWGWSGDLDCVPAGFSTTLVVLSGGSPRELMDRWGAMVVERSGVEKRSCYADLCVSHLSMWTDNGSAYWYKKEAGMDVPGTLVACLEKLDQQGVPVASVELDSWFYEHEVRRAFTDVGYVDVVPPTGMLRWEPRAEVGEGGVARLQQRLGRPLVLHSRHISSKSSYLQEGSGEEGWWVDGDRAHPVGAELWERWMAQAADWGCTAYEQDWLVEIWMGVRQLRAEAGRIWKWQRHLNDAAAAAENMALIWCMATPADMAAAAGLSRVVAVRSCDDYRYAEDPSVLWRWHLTTSCMIKSLGMWPFKDVFMSSTEDAVVADTDGDPNAELEAALSALSAGPVGIGDRTGRTNKQIVMRTCRKDGVLVKPDAPLSALDRSLFASPADTPLLWADTTSATAWRYVLVVHAGRKGDVAAAGGVESAVSETLALGEDGGERLVYDWRAGTAGMAAKIDVSLRTHEWALFVVCPPSRSAAEVTVIGDVGVYATMGQRRMRVTRRGDVEVTGQPGEHVNVAAWSGELGLRVRTVEIPAAAWTKLELQSGWDGEEQTVPAHR